MADQGADVAIGYVSIHGVPRGPVLSYFFFFAAFFFVAFFAFLAFLAIIFPSRVSCSRVPGSVHAQQG